jgi:ubiquinone/menaquinone biosynthesis C-methylase UbiE
MQSKFTEQDTETFYDAEDAIYRSFWDREGSLHWGIFDETTGPDFLKACSNLNDIMAGKARIGSDSNVLDLGCGNGNTATWLCHHHNCRVVGVDLSGVRIDNAKEDLRSKPEDVQARLGFEKASATDLPFPNGSFSHVWSQATIYHIHDKVLALKEAYRVLADGGILVFDDLLKPKENVSQTARTYVYDRLLFDTEFNFPSYQQALTSVGFDVIEAIDLSDHLKTSYQCLSKLALEHPDGHEEKFQALSFAYQQMVQAVENGELGWGFYLCKK